MDALIEQAEAEKVILLLALGGPLVGLIAGTLLGAHRENALPRVLIGVLAGISGTVIYIMWRVYCAMTEASGLDSARNLLVMLLLFATIGAVAGWAVYHVLAKLKGGRENQL